MTQFNDMQLIKRRFFAMRNGVIADTMRRAGAPYKIFFGLNLPQIKDIAHETGVNHDLAMRLWNDVRCRESVMIAPYIMDGATLDADGLRTLLDTAPSVEAVDILCMALLRSHACRHEVFRRLLSDSAAPDAAPMTLYSLLRLALNLGDRVSLEAAHPVAARIKESGSPLQPLRQVAGQLLLELEDNPW